MRGKIRLTLSLSVVPSQTGENFLECYSSKYSGATFMIHWKHPVMGVCEPDLTSLTCHSFCLQLLVNENIEHVLKDMFM